MNEEVARLYKNLETISKSNIQEVFKESPKMLRLLDFLDQAKMKFKTPKAVNYIYAEELKETTYSVLINRFYKLRQSLKEWLLGQLKNNPICFSPEEQELAFLRLLVVQNQHSYALERLLKLETKCWEYNLFELLPEIMQLILRAYDAINDDVTAHREEYYEKLTIASDLEQVLQWMRRAYRGIYNNPNDYAKVVAQMHRKIKNYKTYPRFEMLYHFTAFSNGAYRFHITNKSSNALVRHLNRLEKLAKANPKVPVIYYEPYHREKINLALSRTKSVFWAQRGEFKRAFIEMRNAHKLGAKNPMLEPRRGERSIINNIGICICTKEYDYALKLLGSLEDFYEGQDYEKPYHRLYLEYMHLYSTAFPKFNTKDSKLIEEMVDAYIQILAKQPKTAYNHYEWALATRCDFYITKLELKEASKLLNEKGLKAHYEQFGTWKHTIGLVEALAARDATQLEEYLTKVQQYMLENPPKAIIVLHYEWIIRVLKFYIKEFG
ncbi:MAG: hypothetical protein GY810_04245 [Aureispira sp.]|nr:hypothetical protein [Aureispira sp.]